MATIATGTATAVVLESMAMAKRTNDSPHHPARAANGRVSCRNRTHEISEASANAIESTFLRSVTQATVSTCTGWSAKSPAARSEPGTRIRRRSRHSMMLEPRWSSTFARW